MISFFFFYVKEFLLIHSRYSWRFEWSDDWTVDLSRSFGETDDEGWVYGATFERINEMIKSMNTTGTSTSSSLVRKRRWKRTMICVSEETIAAIKNRRDQIVEARRRIQMSLKEKQTNVDGVKEFETKRVDAHNQAYLTAYQSILNSQNSLKEQYTKLRRLKQVHITLLMLYRRNRNTMSNFDFHPKSLKNANIMFIFCPFYALFLFGTGSFCLIVHQ